MIFQHLAHCLIYSAVFLFQFARHMAYLLKMSSALPTHHTCGGTWSTALVAAWLVASAFLPITHHPSQSSPTVVHGERCERSLQ